VLLKHTVEGVGLLMLGMRHRVLLIAIIAVLAVVLTTASVNQFQPQPTVGAGATATAMPSQSFSSKPAAEVQAPQRGTPPSLASRRLSTSARVPAFAQTALASEAPPQFTTVDLPAAISERCRRCRRRYGVALRPAASPRWDYLDHMVSTRRISGHARTFYHKKDNLRVSWRTLCGATHSRVVFPRAAQLQQAADAAAFRVQNATLVTWLVESRRDWPFAALRAGMAVADLRTFCNELDETPDAPKRKSAGASDDDDDDELYCFGDDAYTVRMESAAAKLRPTVAAAADSSGQVCGGLYTVTARVAEPGRYTTSTAMSFTRGVQHQRATADRPDEMSVPAALPTDLMQLFNRSSDFLQAHWYKTWANGTDFTRWSSLFPNFGTPNCFIPTTAAAVGAKSWSGTPSRPRVTVDVHVTAIPAPPGDIARCTLDDVAPSADDSEDTADAAPRQRARDSDWGVKGRWVNLRHPVVRDIMADHAGQRDDASFAADADIKLEPDGGAAQRKVPTMGGTANVLCALPYCLGNAELALSEGWVFAPYACYLFFPSRRRAWKHFAKRKIVVFGDSMLSHTMFSMVRRVFGTEVLPPEHLSAGKKPPKNPWTPELFEASMVQSLRHVASDGFELFHYHSMLNLNGPFGLEALATRDRLIGPWVSGKPGRSKHRAQRFGPPRHYLGRRPDIVLVGSNTHDAWTPRITDALYRRHIANATAMMQAPFVVGALKDVPPAAMPMYFWRGNIVPAGPLFECSHKQGTYRSAAMDRAARRELRRGNVPNGNATAGDARPLRRALSFRWLDAAELTHAFQFDMAFSDGLHYGGFKPPDTRYRVDYMMAVAWWNAFDVALAGRAKST
jgi:hypothetical protein